MRLSGKDFNIDEYIEGVKTKIMPLYSALQLVGDEHFSLDFVPDIYRDETEWYDTWDELEKRLREFLLECKKKFEEYEPQPFMINHSPTFEFDIHITVSICNDTLS